MSHLWFQPVFLLISLAAASAQDVGLQLIARHYLPGGYSDGTTSGEPDLYGYGLGSLETSFYDPSEKVFYGGSELGFVTISNFGSWPELTLAPFGIPLDSDLTDISVCGDLLILVTKDDPNPGTVHFFAKSLRADDGTLTEPQLIQSVEVGYGPDYVLVNKDCSIVATANEGEGVYDDSVGLINPEGSVSILRGPFDDASSPPVVTEASLNEWTDDELIAKGVHLPLSLNAMIYFNDLNTTDFDVDFTAAIADYTTASVLEPEYLAWGMGETKIYASLQENNAMVIINVETGVAESIHSYGLKDWSQYPIDVVEDGECVLQTIEGLKSLRSPDAIASFTHDGVDYIVTANEGDDLEYGAFEERVSAGDLFVGTSIPAYPGMTADASILDPTTVSEGYSRFFNAECDDTNAMTPFCSDGMRLTLGTAMVDYSDPTAPNIYQMVGIGGRGVTLYSVSDTTGLTVVWDSGDEFERMGCEAFPWAHNSIQDEEFAPVNGTLFITADGDLQETLLEMNDPNVDGCEDGGNGQPGACPLKDLVDDRSVKDGPAPETIVIGEACGEMYMVTSNEKNGIGYLYHLQLDGEGPHLVTTFHLSPVSESLNAGLAYDARSLGEVDAESVQFLNEQDSPTGKTAILFAGAWSGTVSLWEFDCDGGGTTTSGAASSFVSLTGVASMMGWIFGGMAMFCM